jgi:hypothetical protein
MSFKFVKIEMYHKNIPDPLEYGYVLKLSSVFELLEYEAARTDYPFHFNEGFKELNKRHNLTDAVPREHGRSGMGGVAFMKTELGDKGYLDNFVDLVTDTVKAQMKSIEKYGGIYIQSSRGWMPFADNINELTSEGIIESDEVVWPADIEKPRFVKWAGGTHWYIEISSGTIMVDGQQKWNTKKEAKEAYNVWYKENK